jgi:diketogulonate reductase-like aldo/keto reductase
MVESTIKMLSGTHITAFGIGHINTAQTYQNEAEIGVALQKCFEEGVCKKEALFVTSELWSGS